MPKIDWERQIGSRLRLRDLHVFATVVQRGTMAKAAAELGVSQPTVSEVIADLEHILGVRLLDRSRHGVEATIYGNALLRRGRAAFDELKQGVQEIGFLKDSTTGEINIGCPESISTALVLPIIQRFAKQYPRAILNVSHINTPTLEVPEIRNRILDLAIVRWPTARIDEQHSEDLLVDVLFNDDLVVAVAAKNPLSRCRKIDLADLLDEPWLLTPPGADIYKHIAHAFRLRGLDLPKTRLAIQPVALRGDLLATGRYVAALPRSILNLYAKQFPVKVLPVNFAVRAWPVALVMLKNRTLIPLVERFIECAHEVARSISPHPRP